MTDHFCTDLAGLCLRLNAHRHQRTHSSPVGYRLGPGHVPRTDRAREHAQDHVMDRATVSMSDLVVVAQVSAHELHASLRGRVVVEGRVLAISAIEHHGGQ